MCYNAGFYGKLILDYDGLLEDLSHLMPIRGDIDISRKKFNLNRESNPEHLAF